MRVSLTERAIAILVEAEPAVQKAFIKQLNFLARNLHHPSLHAKKYDESQDLWQARINDDWRFYLTIVSGAYIIANIRPHPKWEGTISCSSSYSCRSASIGSMRVARLAGNQIVTAATHASNSGTAREGDRVERCDTEQQAGDVAQRCSRESGAGHHRTLPEDLRESARPRA